MAAFSRLGKYEIRRELGKGAMGIVYEAFDTLIERSVALKVVLPENLNQPGMEDALARFKREAQAAGRLNHQGVVAVYDYGESIPSDAQGHPCGERMAYIAMEFVKGRELRAFFDQQQRFALADIERIMGEILQALGHAHAHGVVHRDIKPANLFVLENGHIKVGDFGIAHVTSSDLTQAGTIMGTPAYMSPEQITGQQVDGRSDLFSCGIILYQLLTGEKPFTGNATTIMYKVMHDMPPPPSALNVGLPVALDAVVRKALAKAPEERWQDAAQFFSALQAAIHRQAIDEDQTIVRPAPSEIATVIRPRPAAADAPTVLQAPANPPSSPPAAVAPHPSPAPNPAPTPVASPIPVPAAASNTASGNKKILIAAGAGLLAAAAAGYWLSNSGKSGQPSPTPTTSNTPSLASSPSPLASSPAITRPSISTEAGQVMVSALGMADPKDPKFNGDAGAAQVEAQYDAKRQMVEKVLAMYVDANSIQQNYPLLEKKLLANYGQYIKTVISEQPEKANKHGLATVESHAILNMREIRRALNQLSKEERIQFIRNNGDPKIAIQMSIANADTAQNLATARSQLAENVLKERIKSFGFRIWANEGEVKNGPNAKTADFQIIGEAKLKQLSAKLPASGLTITKSVLTSWTVKAIDKASNEEIYLNTMLPKGQSWASEDQALADIGRQMGEEFSKDFFLQHFEFATQKTQLRIQGMPDSETAALLLREMQSVRQIVWAELQANGEFQLHLAAGNGSDLLQNHFIAPINQKLGFSCLSLAQATQAQIVLNFANECQQSSIRAKLENSAPAALLQAPGERGKQLARAGKLIT